MRSTGVVVGGLALGVWASAADSLGSSFAGGDSWRAAAIILNSGAVWAGSAFLAGWYVRTWMPAALAGPLALALAVVGYYVYGIAFGNRGHVGFEGLSESVRFWLVAAVVAGPVLGLVGASARSSGAVGLLARLVIPAGVTLEVTTRGGFRPTRHTFDQDPVAAWTLTSLLAAALVAGLLILVSGARSRRRKGSLIELRRPLRQRWRRLPW